MLLKRRKRPKLTWNGEGRPLSLAGGSVRNFSLPVTSLPPHPHASLRLRDSMSSSEESSGEEGDGARYTDIIRWSETEDIQEMDAGSILSPVIAGSRSSILYSSGAWTVDEVSLREEEEKEAVDTIPRINTVVGQEKSDSHVDSFLQYAAPPADTPSSEGNNPSNRRREIKRISPIRARPRRLSPPPPVNQASPTPPPPLPGASTHTHGRKPALYEPPLIKPPADPRPVPAPNASQPLVGPSIEKLVRRKPVPGTRSPLSEDSLGPGPGPYAINNRQYQLSRQLSTTSSLGNDSEFLHFTKHPNVRVRAIVDGLPGSVLASKTPAIEALDSVRGDVVVLGGYRGSVLRDKTANNRRVWIPLKVGLNLRKIDLEVGLNPEDEIAMKDKITPDGMLTNIGPLDLSRRLLKRLRSSALNNGRRVHDWGYDWRLSPALLSMRLIKFLETLPCNVGAVPGVKRRTGQGALVIAHSLGGLIVRHAINQRPELFSGVLFAGSPQTCVGVLGLIRNGDDVMFNSKVFTAQVNFTFRTSFVFLPEDGQCFIDRRTGKPIPIDFFNATTWMKHRLSPCASAPLLPPLPARPGLSLSRPTPDGAQHRSRPRSDTTSSLTSTSSSSSTTTESKAATPERQKCTIPLSKAIPYLQRTLADTLKFKRELGHDPVKESAGLYPPMTVLYCKTLPTVRGMWVDGEDGIRNTERYDDLVFGAGDGVTLATQAQLPPGYKCARRVAVDRGHVSLLGDLEGVGRCLESIIEGRGW